MDPTTLLAELNAYQAATPHEERMRRRMVRFVGSHPRCCSRALAVGHITTSAWVIDREATHVLLTHHRKLHRWLQLGGHTEGEARLIDSAIREATEESGLTGLIALRAQRAAKRGSKRMTNFDLGRAEQAPFCACSSKESIFDLDIHSIPARGPEPEHLHYDVRFLLQANRRAPLLVSSESKDLAWVRLDQVHSLNPAESMMRMVRKSQNCVIP